MRYLLLALLLIGCDNPLGVDLPDNAVETEPHPLFSELWDEVERDSGIEGDFAAVRWFRVTSGPWVGEGGQLVPGAWHKQGNGIYLADEHWTDRGLIRHEILHSLLQGDSDHQHPLFKSILYLKQLKSRTT